MDIDIVKALYTHPFPSTRTGDLFNAFSYPTKISPESEALFIACHSKKGDVVLDPFGGSGTTGVATLLCDCPTTNMISLAKKYGLSPEWGPRKAVVYELSALGSMLGDVLCHTKHDLFEEAAKSLLNNCREMANSLYSTIDDEGKIGVIRHVIWSDVIKCPKCGKEVRYADVAIKYNPLSFEDNGTCPYCGGLIAISEQERVKETKFDPILKTESSIKKRVPYKIYGSTNGRKWQRFATSEDVAAYKSLEASLDYANVPNYKIKWGELFRQGYHYGITHIHHFYTARNVVMFSHLWAEVSKEPIEIQNALKIFLLSYNAAHSTLMTRVVAKKNSKDFVLTGAQPGVLYISSLPVEKNIFSGLERKVKTFVNALSLIDNSKSEALFINTSSTSMDSLSDNSVNYIFTDPPFGDFIPYSEINQINECWLGRVTSNDDEVVINTSQGKTLQVYSSLMTAVFKEMASKLKDSGLCTLVFHSAKAEIWRAIIKAYKNSGLNVNCASVLDKTQKTFKQTNSNVAVKGDPIILLEKEIVNKHDSLFHSDIEVAEYLLRKNEAAPKDKDGCMRLYSKYIIICIENNLSITLDAKHFFENGSNE